MILHKSPIENDKFILKYAPIGSRNYFVLARQALYTYLMQCNEEIVLAPRYLAGGVYLPLIKSNKKIIYYDLKDNFEIDPNSYNLNHYPKDNVIFYYIHHFGLFIKPNIEYLIKLKNEGYHIIDDRALTLPSNNYKEFADATIYSLYKLLGVPYGAFINSNKMIELKDLPRNDNFQIEKIMQKNLDFYGASYIQYLPSLIFRVINKIYGNSVNFNPIVESNWDKNNFITKSNILDKIDFDKINEIRIELAKQYLDNLNPNCLISYNSINYLHQSMIGFPIFTNNPESTHRILISKGIHSFILKRGWWFDSPEKQWKIVNNHLLLPLHHHLGKSEVMKVSRIVNKILS